MKSYPWLVILLSLQLLACSAVTNQKASDDSHLEVAASSAKTSEDDKPASRSFPAESFHDLLVAEFAVRRDQLDVALDHYVKQAYQTRDPGVISRASRLAQHIKADQEALDVSQLWVDIEPDNLEAQYTTSTMLAKYKQPLKALEHMEAVLQGGGSTNFTAIAASTLKMPKLSRILVADAIEELISRHPNYGQLYVSRAIMEQQQGKLNRALASTRRGIALNKNDIQAAVIETRLLQELGRDEQALTRLAAIQNQFPNNRRLRLQYARLLLKNDISKARVQFIYLLASTPNDPDLLLSLALISSELRDTEQAKYYFQRLLATNTRDNEVQYYLAQLAEREQNYAQAIKHYQAISVGDDYIAASNRIAELYSQQDNITQARSMLKTRRQQHPDLALRLYLLEAELLFKDNQYEACYQLLSEGLIKHPQQASLLYMRSLISEKRNDIALVERDLRMIIEQDPNNATALNALGYILANRSERLEQAYSLIRRALAIKPDDPAILDSLGWVEYRRGNLEIAGQLLSKAFQAFPDPEVAAHLGEVLWQQGQTKQAEHIWQQALKNAPNSPILKETIQRLLRDTDSPNQLLQKAAAAPAQDPSAQ